MNFKKIAVLLFLFLLLLHPPLCAEPKDDNLVFTVFGDSRVAFQGAPIPVAYKRILTEINLINPDLIVHAGDLVFGYGDSEEQLKIEYSNVGKLVSTVVPKIYFVPGNHDFQTPLTTKHFIELTGQKRDYFSFDRKGVTFIILNTDVPGQVGEITGEQRKWLENELEKKKTSRAIFVFMHRPLFSFLKPNADDKGDLPEGEYTVKGESLVSAHQMVKIGEALGAMRKGSPEVEKATEKEIQGLIKEYLKPYIHKIEPNKEKRNMVQVWISLDTPFSVLLTVSPES